MRRFRGFRPVGGGQPGDSVRRVAAIAAGLYVLFVLCSGMGLAGDADAGRAGERVITINNQRVVFVRQNEAGCVVGFDEAPGMVLQNAAKREPIRGARRPGVEVFHSGKDTRTVIEALRADKRAEYVAPLYSVNGQTVAIIPEIVVRLRAKRRSKELAATCKANKFTIIRKLDFTEREYLVSPRAKDADDVFEAVDHLNRAPCVEWAVPNIAFRPRLYTTPNDPYFPDQWHLHNTGQSGGSPDADMDVPEAWDVSTGSADIVVAVIDEGVDTDHPDLVDNIVPGYDYYDNDDTPDPTGDGAHGTACAGIIAARGNNGIGVCGVTWNCKIMPIRISGDLGFVTDEDIATGIRWAATEGADVMSNSWGASAPLPIIHSAIQDVTEAGGIGRGGLGCVVVVAAGNDGEAVAYPAAYSEVIAVGATDKFDQAWYYSNAGPELDVSAPSGETNLEGDIWTTDIAGSAGYNNRAPGILDYTDKMGGTSGACPNAAGVAALILSVAPNLGRLEVQEILQNSADDLGPAGRDDSYGYGRVNAYAALSLLSGRDVAVQYPNGGEGFEAGSTVSIAWQTTGVDWNPADEVMINYSANAGADWSPVPGAGNLLHDLGLFNWDTTGLAPGSQYFIRVTALADANATDTCDGTFAITGPLDHFDLVMDSPQGNGDVVTGTCTVTAKDAAGSTINSISGFNTVGRFPVVISAPGVAVRALSGGGDELEPAGFVEGVADLASLGMILTVASAPVTVQFTASSADGKVGVSGDVTIQDMPDYFTEWYASGDFDLAGLSILFVPDGSFDYYTAYCTPILELPTDPVGGVVLSLSDDDYEAVAPAGGPVPFYGEAWSTFYVGSNGYVTFTSGDREYFEDLVVHFELPRISALFDDLEPDMDGEVSWKELPDRVAVTFQNVPEYGESNSNTFQIEMFFDGQIVISYLNIDAWDGLAGLSQGAGVPADFLESDLSAYPPLPGRTITVETPNGGEGFEAGSTVPVTWSTAGGHWQPGDEVMIDYSANAAADWSPVPGAGNLAHDLGLFNWDTTGLAPGSQYLIRVTALADANATDTCDGAFAMTGPLDHFDLAVASPQINGDIVTGTCTLAAKDAAGSTITTFGSFNTAGRFPVVISAPGVTVTALSGGGDELDPAGFLEGVADLAGLGMIPTVASPPVTVQFTASSADGKEGSSGDVTIVSAPLHHFEWGAVSSPQYVNEAFSATVTAKDANGHTVADFDGCVALSGNGGPGAPAIVVISEINTDESDWIEFTNVSGGDIDISGWQITWYDWDSYPAPQATFAIPPGTTCPADSVFLLREEGTAPGSYPGFYTGSNIYWNNDLSENQVVVLLCDAVGSVVDVVCAVDGYPSPITSPIAIPAEEWQSDPIPGNANEPLTYQRIGNADNNDSGDWVVSDRSTGAINDGLFLPFTGAVGILPDTACLAGGVWTGEITILEAGTSVCLRADDGSGHIGYSSTFTVLAQFRTLTVLSSPVTGVIITGTKPGATGYTATCYDQQAVELTAPATVEPTTGAWSGRVFPFVCWCVDNEPQPAGQATLQLTMDGDHVVMAVYDWRLPGDVDDDCKVTILDMIFVRNKLSDECSSD